MKDGLYRVTTPIVCAGFTVRSGGLDACAPIIRTNVGFFITIAEYLGPEPAPKDYAKNNSDSDSCPKHGRGRMGVLGLHRAEKRAKDRKSHQWLANNGDK